MMRVPITRRAVLAGAAAFSALPRPADAQSEPTVLRLSSSPADDTMPVLFANQNGAFKKAGLDVQLARATSGSSVASGVAGGAVDIGKSSIVSVITARAKGVPFVWVAPAAVYNPAVLDGALVVAPSSPIKTARDLNGKIIGSPALGDLNTIAARAWVDQNGGDSKTLQFVEIPVSAQVAALVDSRIAAAGLINPFLGEAVNDGKVRVLGAFYGAIAPHFMFSGWFTTADWAAKHKDALAAFRRIVETTSAYTNAHHAETAPLLATWSGLTPEAASKAPRMTTGTRTVADDVQPVIDLLAKYGVIPKAFDAKEMIA